MKNLLIGLFCFISYPDLFSQTSSDVEKIAKNGLEQTIASESQGALKLINFKKTDGIESNFVGESIYDLKFQIEIEVVKSYYLNTGLSQPFVGVQGSGWKYFECTTQGEGFLYKVRLTIGQKYSLVGNATLIENNNGFYFSGYEITSHKEVSGASSNSAEVNKSTFPISTSKDVYCKYDKGNLVGVNEQYKKYVGYWANINNECFAIKYKDGVFKIFMDCSYNPETQATFTTTDEQADIEVGPQISFHIDTLSYTLIFKNDCYLMSITKYEKPLKSKAKSDLLYYDVKLNSNDTGKNRVTLVYNYGYVSRTTLYSVTDLKKKIMGYIDSSNRFSKWNEDDTIHIDNLFTLLLNVNLSTDNNGSTTGYPYQGIAEIKASLRNGKNDVITEYSKIITTSSINRFNTEQNALEGIIDKIDRQIFLSIYKLFPINAQIIEIIERDKKGNAKTVKINAGEEMGVCGQCKLRIEDSTIINNQAKNKWQLEVISVNEDGTSTCKVLGLEAEITKAIDSGKFISVTTIYDAVE